MTATIRKDVDPFTVVPNQVLNSMDISLSAKGMYAYMKSKPDNWNFTIRSMAKQLKEGQTAISSAVKELRDAGLVTYKKNTDGTGIYFVHASFPRESLEPENPNHGNPNEGKPKRISNTDLSSKKDCSDVLTHLNQMAGTSYRPVDSNLRLIEARIKEGATVADMKRVIDAKCSEWKGSDMEKYLRPQTLFNASKFEQYLGALGKPAADNEPSESGGMLWV